MKKVGVGWGCSCKEPSHVLASRCGETPPEMGNTLLIVPCLAGSGWDDVQVLFRNHKPHVVNNIATNLCETTRHCLMVQDTHSRTDMSLATVVHVTPYSHTPTNTEKKKQPIRTMIDHIHHNIDDCNATWPPTMAPSSQLVRLEMEQAETRASHRCRHRAGAPALRRFPPRTFSSLAEAAPRPRRGREVAGSSQLV